MDDTPVTAYDSPTAQRFLLGLRLASIVIATVLLLTLSLPNLLRSGSKYHSLPVQLACFTGYAIIVLTGTVLILRRRSWGHLLWVALAVTIIVSVVSEIDLKPGFAITTADWSFGCVGWIGVIFLTERPLKEMVAFLATQEVAYMTNAVLTRPAGRTSILLMATTSLGSVGFPLLGAIAITALRFIATAAEKAAHESEQVRVAEAVADELHQRRLQRFADLYDTAVPLLRGLANNVLDINDDTVRRQCAIEAARMRRLFAEMDTAPNPLMHELRHCADVADRKGIVVEMEDRGSWPDPPPAVRRALTEAPLTVYPPRPTGHVSPWSAPLKWCG